ncbi:glycosyltransferase family 1 protein [Collybiopsis luxurians FD-317 M1]|uniref:Glycosyltransferase family 1 protein n=1 Tax=Collybiopsis luxurians FD-317 M1 TaxID=944289 RepID=A0A0D0BTE0_9AGAR|nr:glycosyltransferase family 1 protein [Collybiopsis luxurians FD-317 M1]
MGSIAQNHKHVVVHAFPAAWGHNKPLCSFVVHILESEPQAIVTCLTAGLLYSKIIGELKRLPPAKYEAFQSRLHILDIAGSNFDMMKPLEAFAPAFATLYSSAPITCLSSEKTVSGLPKPTLAVIDVSSAQQI